MITEQIQKTRRADKSPRVRLWLLLLGIAGGSMCTTTAHSAVVETSVSSATELAYQADASAADLLHGLTATTTGWNTGNNADPQEIHDGVHGNTFNDPPSDPVQGGWTTVGATAEYDLGLGADGEGWDITNIQSIAAWNGAGFGNQGWTVEVKLKGVGSYTPLATVDYQPLGGSAAGATKVTLTDDTTGVLASGVEYIKVTANSVNGGANGGAFVWRELDVFGVETAASVPGVVSWSNMGVSNITTTSAWAYATLGGTNGTVTLYWKEGVTNPPFGHTGWDGANGPALASTGRVERAMSGLTADTAYTCVFYATNSVGSNEAWKASSFATGLTATQTPVFTSAIAAGATVNLGWEDKASTETGYILQRSDSGSNGPYTVVATLDANTTSHPDSGLSSGTYHYRLAATNDGNGSVTDFAACQTNVVVNAPTLLKIMPLGDSITVGYTDNPSWANHPFKFGYRSGLYTRLTDAGYNFQFVGASTEPWTGISGDPTHGGTYTPELDLRDFGQDNHRGYGGAGIWGNVNAWIAADDPDIILLLIGINGMGGGSEAALENLVTSIVTTAPDVHLIVAQITPYASFNQTLFDYNVDIRDDLVPRLAGNGHKISTVDLYSFFLTDPSSYTTLPSTPSAIEPGVLSNNINHPDNTHYDMMAQAWFDGIEALGLLPTEPAVDLTPIIPAVGHDAGLSTNAPPGTLVGTLSMVNTNAAGFTYALHPSADYATFQILDATSLRTIGFPAKDLYTVNIVGTKDAFSVTNTFTIDVTVPAIDRPVFEVTAEGHPGTASFGRHVGTLKARARDSSPIGFTITGGRDDLFAISDQTNLVQVAGHGLGPVGTVRYVEVTATNAATSRPLQIAVEVVSGTPSGMILIVQ